MPAKKATETPDPKAEQAPSGALGATVRAFNPARAGTGKFVGAIAIVVATVTMAILFDLKILPTEGIAFYLYSVLVGIAGNVLRHFGSRWTVPK